MTNQNNAAQPVLTDEEIREIQGTHLVTVRSRDALIKSVIIAGRAIESAVLSRLRAPVAGKALQPVAVVRDNPEDYGTMIDALVALPVGTQLFAAPQASADSDIDYHGTADAILGHINRARDRGLHDDSDRLRRAVAVMIETAVRGTHWASIEAHRIRRDMLLSVLGKLNSNPYNMMKHECVDLVREMFNKADAAPQASAEARNLPHIKQPLTLTQIEAEYASHDYSAELLLQHALLLLRRSQASDDAVRNAALTPLLARALAEWHEDDGPVTWWAWCGHEWAGEAPWCGTPLDQGWPGYHTHWTPIPGVPAVLSAPQAGNDSEPDA